MIDELTDEDVKTLITTGHFGTPEYYWPKFEAWLKKGERSIRNETIREILRLRDWPT